MANRVGPASSLSLITFMLCCFVSGPAWSGNHEEDKTPADVAETNIEHSEEIMDETYEASRAAGEGPIQAAGDAYNAVLDENIKKADDE